MAEKIEKALKSGAWIAVVVYLMNYLLSLINVQPKTLFGVTDYISLSSPFSGTIGNKFISILQNYITFDIGSVVAVYLSSVVIFLVGSYLYDMIKMPKVKGDWQYLTAVIVYGTIPFYLIFVGYGMPAMSTLFGFVVYVAAIAFSLQIFKGVAKNLI